MKKIILLLFIGALTFNVSAQSNSLTAGIGLLNPKVRVQFEHGFGDMHSTGANLGYYFANWTGPRLEGFYRIYFGGDNEKGMFMQTSAGAGAFSYALDDDAITDFYYYDASGQYVTSSIYKDGGTWITAGGGIAFGGKLTTRGGFVFESTMGYHFWSPPPSNYSSDYDDFYVSTGSALETLGYYVVGPGFPLHFQVKLGFNF